MRTVLFTFIFLISFQLSGQNQCSRYISLSRRYEIEIIENKKIEILKKTEKDGNSEDNIFIGEVIFESKKFHFRKDTLIIFKDNKKYFFKWKNGEILIALTDINKFIKKRTEFYCTLYNLSKGRRLFGGYWKNHKKQGIWVSSENGSFYRCYYKNDKILKKEIFLSDSSKFQYKNYLIKPSMLKKK